MGCTDGSLICPIFDIEDRIGLRKPTERFLQLSRPWFTNEKGQKGLRHYYNWILEYAARTHVPERRCR